MSLTIRTILFAAPLLALPAHATLVELTDVAQLDARGDHACVVTTGGAVQCWGENWAGQLGGGSGARWVAGPVTGLSSGAVAVAVNGSHSCAVMVGGSVKCWGYNGSGQLGDGTTTNSAVPVDVQGLPWPVAALSLGTKYSCALSAAGAVACWGANSSGQLGDGTTMPRLAPTPVTGLSSGVTKISAGQSYTCAIAAGGVVKCWGGLGGSYPSVPTPYDINGLPAGATALSTGGAPDATYRGSPLYPEIAYACAVVAGTTKCWGNPAGFLYPPPIGASTAPIDVAGVASGATAITSGGGRSFQGIGSFTFAQNCVVTAGNGVQCWGANYCGIVGVPTGADCNLFVPQFAILPPTDVPGLSSGVASVSAASLFTCALQSAGTVKCWGGQYGTQPVAQMSGTIPQAITLQPIAYMLVGGTSTLGASGGGSGIPVIVSSQTPGTCSISGNTITAIAAGTCTLIANQAGNTYYDAAPEATLSFTVWAVSAEPRMVNVSTRLQVGSGEDVLIGGFVIGGSSNKTVAIVATGPSLAQFGITNPLANPTLRLVRASDQQTIATNDDWQAASNAADLQATGFAPTNPLEAGILANLPPGAYTAIVSGAGGGTGVSVVGIYEVDKPEAPLVNISTRGRVLTGDNVMIGGFVIHGDAARRVAIVATGPSLSQHGIAAPLANPTLTLMRSSDQAIVATNDNWTMASNASELVSTGFAPSVMLESAILITLPPGAYTAIVSGADGGTGVSVIGVYQVN